MRGAASDAVRASWDEELIRCGSRIVVGRLRFLEEFGVYLERAYSLMEAATERPLIVYSGLAPFEGDEEESRVHDVFAARLQRTLAREREQGYTLVGPHRDELVFTIDGHPLRNYASQGQHRTFALAVKLAQYLYLHERLGEYPLLLLDDVFDTLDARRVRIFLSLLQGGTIGQSLITAAQCHIFRDAVSFACTDNQMLRVEGGIVASVS